MSTRHIKKVLGSDTLHKKDSENESETENPTIHNANFNKFNIFDVLDQNSDDNTDSENKQVVKEFEEEFNDKVKFKKKKKKQKKNDQVKGQQPEKTDEIEKIIKEVNQLLGEPISNCSSEKLNNLQWIKQTSKESILSVQHKHLNPYNELKRMFGCKTIQAEQNNTRNRTRIGHMKKTWLVSPRHIWPSINKSGLSMSLDDSVQATGNVQYFVYNHGVSYRQIQLRFLEVIETFNLENVLDIISMHSYHVDALLQMADIFQLNEDLATAAEFIERALYCLECAFHPSFNITTGLCRLDYRKQQNRALFITLFKHLTFLSGRACYRTSLEFCKFLLSLDPEGDPLAVVLSIDFYALRAKEYKWFIDFCNLWDSTRNLTQLPNIAYNLALAHFYLGDQTMANTLLQNALIMFPGVLVLLLDKCSIETDAKVRSHTFFISKATTATTRALEKLQDFYVARCFHLWKDAELLPWLRENVHAALTRVDNNDDYVKFCNVKRSKRYQGKLPRNILRHIILSDIKDVTISGHEVQNEGAILSYDPLPPTDSIDIYEKSTSNATAKQTNASDLSLFFSFLLSDTADENVFDRVQVNDDNE